VRWIMEDLAEEPGILLCPFDARQQKSVEMGACGRDSRP
jgi:hypothetical protein